MPRSELAYLCRPPAARIRGAGRQYLRLQLHRAQQLRWAAGLPVESQRLRFDGVHDVTAFDAALERLVELDDFDEGPLATPLHAPPDEAVRCQVGRAGLTK